MGVTNQKRSLRKEAYGQALPETAFVGEPI